MFETDAVRIREFLDALEADEFERLVLGARVYGFEHLRDVVDVLEVQRALSTDGESALWELKGRMALERLQQRHPETWQRVALAGAS